MKQPISRTLAMIVLVGLMAGCASTAAPPEERHPDDPWEPFNRSVHQFNQVADRAVLRPLALGYDHVTPDPVQRGIGNFFRNLRSPVIMVNLLLQGRGSDLESEFQRFVTNTLYGVGGVFDVASAGGIDKPEGDFGQTLATWGWSDSRYLVLPLLGPSTIRDSVGRGVDTVPDIAWRLAYQEGSYFLVGLNVIHMRAGLLPLDAEIAAAYDEYIMMRDGWMQRRSHLIFGEDADLPDYDAWLEEDDWDEW